jgi:hypothetical protein
MGQASHQQWGTCADLLRLFLSVSLCDLNAASRRIFVYGTTPQAGLK